MPYRQWMDQGYLIATPGNTVDYDYIVSQKIKNQTLYNVQSNEFGQWNATSVQTQLMAQGVPVSNFSQAISSISFPTKELERLIYEGKIIYDGNPLVRWALASCILYRDANENIKVTKKLSHATGRRVDPIIALIMALGGSLTPEENNESQYNEQETAYI